MTQPPYVPTHEDRASLFDMQVGPRGEIVAKHMANDDLRRDREVREAWREAIDTGWTSYSVYSIMPYAQTVGPICGRYYHIPAAEQMPDGGVRVVKLHVDTPIIDNKAKGGEFASKPVLPKSIAGDIVGFFDRAQSVAGRSGCVICLPDRDNTRELTEAELGVMLANRMQWYRRLKRVADATWARHPGSHGSIDPNAIIAANAMRARGELTKMPDWASETRDTSVERDCPSCGELIKKSARMCRHCRFELDPAFFANLRPAAQSGQPGAPVKAAVAPLAHDPAPELGDAELGLEPLPEEMEGDAPEPPQQRETPEVASVTASTEVTHEQADLHRPVKPVPRPRIPLRR